MTDDKTPPPDDASSKSTSSNPLDFPTILNSAKELIAKPKNCLEKIKSMATNSGDYFSSNKDKGLNASLGFFLVVLTGLLVFKVLQGVFSLSIVGIFFAVPSVLIFAILYLAIGTGLIHLIAMTLGQSKENFWQGAVIVSQLSWIILIWEFPIWVFLPGLLKALITVAAYLFWAYLAIPATATKYAITTGKHVIPVWAVSGVLSLIVLMGAFAGAGVEKAGDYYAGLSEEAKAQFDAQAEIGRQNDEEREAWIAAAKSNPDLVDIKLKIELAVRAADFINEVDENDINRINNIGGNRMYETNKTQLQYGIDAIAVLASIENYPDAPAQKKQIELAQKKLERLRISYIENQKAKAAAPPQTAKKSSSQKLWLNGSMYCEITKTGQVWIRSNKVGDIESNGKIWVQSSQKGSLEKNGDVWHDGRKVGSITEKGEVWKGGRKIGLVEENGKVWIGGSAKGEIVGEGDPRRAAIVYYFDFF